jgi:hypothetical protein
MLRDDDTGLTREDHRALHEARRKYIGMIEARWGGHPPTVAAMEAVGVVGYFADLCTNSQAIGADRLVELMNRQLASAGLKLIRQVQ